MASISLKDVGVTATSPLFQHLTLTIAEGDCVGLIAQNGGGKSTLLRCLAGTAEVTSGDIVRSRGLRLGLVEQDIAENLRPLTLHEAIRRALSPEQREDESWRVDVVLDEFEAPADMRDRPVSALSGGWQRLMLIARVWVTEPDALLLDEPTNHLDLAKLYWLENWLKPVSRNLPVVVASHDRDFLDAVTNRTLFLRPGTSRVFALPFSAAKTALAGEDNAAEASREKDMKEASRLRRNAGELKNIGINSGSDLLQKKAKQLRERAESLEQNVKAVHRERSGDIRLGNSGTHARVMVAFDDVAITRPDGEPLFRTGRLHLFQGDRIVLLGRNGAGKSQFIKLLRRAIEAADTVPGVKVSPQLALGYMDQDLSQLRPEQSPVDLIGRFGQGDQRTASLLAGAGFAVEKQGRPIGQLSFGQRARLALLALRLAEPNFYLLDEPTNHIDITGQEALEGEILAHGATAVLVSHDRRFVRDIGTRFLLIGGRRLREVDGPEGFFAAMAAEAAG